MSDLVDQITRVLRAHYPSRLYHSPPSCACGWVNRQYGINDSTEWDQHVAERVEAELQLAEQKSPGFYNSAAQAAVGGTRIEPTNGGPWREVTLRRWVSAWSEVQP